MMSLIRITAKSSRPIQVALGNQWVSSLNRNSPRLFTTDAQNPPPAPPPQQPRTGDLPPRPIPNLEANGKVYGRINLIGRFASKTDIIAMMGDCHVTVEDVKFEYNTSFNGTSVVIQFRSQADYSTALRAVTPKTTRQGGLLRVDRMQWENVRSYDGKSIVLQGIPRNAVFDDVERFLSGCQYDASSIDIRPMPLRPGSTESVKRAVVNFPSRLAASHAFITKNRGFCLNNQISIRILH
ncbi:unnamed protein product [Cuscuta campestris]|uniref:Uncharacterized protein n=1 Tax=Cuscuta campestris TaxID=132261 RepID=A0A484K604_9ASTE|nr:unnamed protein product [Cuscuta campestris]